MPAPAACFASVWPRRDGPDNLILYRGRKAFVILNRFPYTNGHLMIVPFDHQASLEALDVRDTAEVMELATRALGALRRAYGAEAFNLGVNIGAVAGAGVADHVHLHVVPRWAGDTNFMATIAEARVIPEDAGDHLPPPVRGRGAPPEGVAPEPRALRLTAGRTWTPLPPSREAVILSAVRYTDGPFPGSLRAA